MNREQKDRITDLLNEIGDLQLLLLHKPMTDGKGKIFTVGASDEIVEWTSLELINRQHQINEAVYNINLLAEILHADFVEEKK